MERACEALKERVKGVVLTADQRVQQQTRNEEVDKASDCMEGNSRHSLVLVVDDRRDREDRKYGMWDLLDVRYKPEHHACC